MPLVAAATSLSRTVAKARPGRLRTRLRPYHSDTATSTSPTYHSRSSVPYGTPRITSRSGLEVEKLNPNSSNGGTATPR